IDSLWKGPKYRARASIRIAVEGALFFKSGIGWMSGVIAFICTSREALSLHGRRSISPRHTAQCFGVSCGTFWNRQGSPTCDGGRHPTAVFISPSLLRTVMVENRRLLRTAV